MTDDTSASAPAGLAGYFYQVDVSIYVALDLMLAQRRLDQITLEPANHEDLAGDLKDDAQVSGATRISVEDYGLVVQAKLRNIEPWSIEDLAKLVSRDDDAAKPAGHPPDGRKRRDSPAQLLKADPRLRYLLITSAALKGTARDLGVRRLGDWPATLPATLKAKAPDATGRIAVLDQFDEDKLEGKIRELLQVTCKVPRANLDLCLDDLRKIALEHMRTGPSVWTRGALELTIGKHEGYLASAPQIAGFVKPTNWRSLVEVLRSRYGVIITGPSGTGKTMAAEVLLDKLKTKVDGAFKVVRVTHGPQQVWAWNEPGPVVFMIEDPWGKFRFHPDSRPWNAELEAMLRSARSDRRFIVTTRSDVFAETQAKRLSPEWFVRLDTQHYGASERRRLFENRLAILPEEVQRAAHQDRDLVFERLESPYEIQKFFDGLREGPREGEVGPALVRRCIDASHYDAIETTVVEQVLDRDDGLPAVALWGMLKARPSLTWNIVPHLAQALGDKDRDVEDRIEPLIRFMTAGRNLRQPNAAVSYYHPRVEAGLEQVVKTFPSRARRLLGDLVDVLIALDAEDGADWGQEAAAQLIQGAKRDTVDIRISPQAQARLDAYLRRRLTTPGDTLEADMELAADVGALDNQPANLARWLAHRGKEFGNLDVWREVALSAPAKAEMATDPDVSAFAARFIREILPRSRDSFRNGFIASLAEIAGPQTEAYRDAAMSMVSHGHNWNAETVTLGALVDLAGFERVIDAAVAESRRLRLADDASLWLEIRNGEHSEAYAEHLADNDDGDTAETFIRAYVEAARRLDGWRRLASHRHVGDMLWAWIVLLYRDDVEPAAGELAGLADACRGHRHEGRFWELAATRWSPELKGRLDALLRATNLPASTRTATLEAMARQAPQLGREILADMAAAGDLTGILRWMVDLKALLASYRVHDEIKAFGAQITIDLGPFTTLAGLVLTGEVAALGPADLDRLVEIDPGGSADLLLAQARLLAASGRAVQALVRQILSSPGDEDVDIARCVSAVALAVSQEDWDIVEDSLGHRFADVRRDALIALAPREPLPLAPRFLELAEDKGSRVRLALLDILKERPDPAHQGALLKLIEDTWTRAEIYYGEDIDYPIAAAAAGLLAVQAPLSAAAVETVLQVATNSDDPDLRRDLMIAVGKQGGDHGLDRLVELALELGRLAVHAAAADALFLSGGMGPERAARFDADQLLRRGPPIAVRMALAVAAQGERAATLALAKAMWAVPDRAVLLVPLLFGALSRGDGLAEEILRMLPDAVAQPLGAMLQSGGKAPASVLDGLGEFRVRDAVLWRLGGLFEKAKPGPG